MTPIAALVAEAIQLARENTPPLVNDCARVTYRGTDSAWAWYTRDDVRDAALAHLATRAAESEERAARLRREVCDAIHEYTVSGDTRGIADDLRRAVDEYDAAEEVSRG